VAYEQPLVRQCGGFAQEEAFCNFERTRSGIVDFTSAIFQRQPFALLGVFADQFSRDLASLFDNRLASTQIGEQLLEPVTKRILASDTEPSRAI